MANITGWGRGTWSEATWGEPIPVEVTGVSITAELGNETITANADVSLTGIPLSITLDSVIIPNVEAFPIGIAMSTTLDSVTITADVDITLSGLNLLSAELGNESITVDVSVDTTGTELTMVVDSVGIEAGVGWEGAVQDVNSMKIVRRVEVRVGFTLAPFETKDTQTSKASMSRKSYTVKENIQCIFQYVLWRVGKTGAMDNRGYGADQ